MANLSAIKLPNGTTYSLKDSGALQLTGGQVTGPVSFGDSVTMDEVTTGDLVVNGSASFTNNIQANTINGVEVGTNPKFTDTNTVTTVSTTGSGNAVTAVTASNGALTVTKGTTFLTSHQDISGKADKSATVSTVAYDSTNQKITKTINGTTSDVVTVATLKTALGSMPASDVYSWAKASSKPTYTASEVGALASSTKYAGSSSAGGAANALANFKVTTTTNLGVDAPGSNAVGYVSGLTKAAWNYQQTDGALYTQWYSASWIHEIFGDYRTGQISIRGRNNGTWQSWRRVLDESNWSTFISIPTSLPASDVYSWAKASTKPTYTASEVGALASDTTYVSKITTTAGAHTAISNKSGAVSFNVPTKTSHLTNDSGFLTSHQTITKAMVTTALGTGSGTTKFLREDGSWATPAYIANTDEKLKVVEITSATQYYPLVGTATAGATGAIRQYDTTGFKYKGTTGTTSAVGSAIVELGNSTASGTAGNKQAQLIMYGSNAKKATITLAAPSADIALALPTSGGTLALTSQIPTVSYPVTSVNSKTGAVSLTASDVGALASNTTYVSKITTSAGTHSAISNKSGAVSFNVPTKTSHLTNDSGFLTAHQNAFTTIGVESGNATVYSATAPGATLYFKAENNITLSETTNNNTITVTIRATDTTYESKSAASGGTDVSLVTTGEKYTWNSKTSNTGTVTKVTAGTGLSIGTTSGGNFTTSGTINHTNSVTAQTTQALYPIKIDAQGHISAYGSAVTSLPASDVSDWAKADSKPSYTASEVGAVPTTRTVNGKALSANVADADYITEEGTSSSWNYRKWHSGKVEAWRTIDFASANWSTWASPVRYMDKTLTFPSGLFPSNGSPSVIATSCSNQYWVVGCTVTSTTQATLRIASVTSTAMATTIRFYAYNV